MFKFIFAAAGFYFLKSFGGAILGFFIGTFVDNFQKIKTFSQQQGGAGGARGFSSDDLFSFYQQRTSNLDFATMLIALSAAIMRADGKVLKAELEYVKAFFKQQFGPQFSVSHLQDLKRFLDSDDIPLEQICADIRNRTQIEARVQLLYYLFGIAKADGDVSNTELLLIQRISQLMGVPNPDFESVKNMFYRDVNSDYKVLEIENTATNEEIKKAYRQMAIKYHPDKVASLGEEFQKGAKEKFQKIQEAYENIKKNKGFV
ncbi:MAG: TerB family tellurite resistance protein [Bacteroidota bacterium]